MYYNGINYYLTKHGRKRFIERFGHRPDNEILDIAINGADGYLFVWAPDRKYPVTGRRLVTVLFKYKHVAKGEQYVDLIADRLQSNNSSGVVLVHGIKLVPNQVP